MRLPGHTRAFVQVQNGCDHRCTFCIIPFGRGNSRSLPVADVVAQVRALAERGYREVVLTGVDITSYGDGEARLGALVKRILKDVPDIARLRLSSIDSVEADADLIDALANEPRLMPHLHLSLQAGDDLILKRMKRRHSRADAIDVLQSRAPLAAGRRVRRRHHRRLPHRERSHVCAFARSGGRLRVDAIACVSVFAAARHAGGAHAAARPCRGQGARAAFCAKRARRRWRGISLRQVGSARRVLTERGGIGRTEQFTPVRLASPIEPGVFLDLAIAGHDGRQLLAA